MKRLYVILGLLMIALTACCQSDQTFNKPIYANYGIYFGDGTFQNSASSGSGSVTWDAIIGKPATFLPSTHNHDAIYKAIGYVPSWVEITGKPLTFPPSAHTHLWTDITDRPEDIELVDCISKIQYIEPHAYTTTEINALVIPVGKLVIVVDKTLGVLKFYNGTKWKTLIASE